MPLAGLPGPRKSPLRPTVVVIFITRAGPGGGRRAARRRSAPTRTPRAAAAIGSPLSVQHVTPGSTAQTAPPFYGEIFYYRTVSVWFCPLPTPLSSTPRRVRGGRTFQLKRPNRCPPHARQSRAPPPAPRLPHACWTLRVGRGHQGGAPRAKRDRWHSGGWGRDSVRK